MTVELPAQVSISQSNLAPKYIKVKYIVYIGKLFIVQISLKDAVEGHYLVQDSVQEVRLD